MINKKLKINFDKKIISYTGKKEENYSAKELYSFLMDIFDEPENMRYEIPIRALSNDKFELINGWVMKGGKIKGLAS